MCKVTILKGLPASGKTTWAKEQVREGKGKIKRVNKDDLREMIDSGIWSVENEEYILQVRDLIIESALIGGHDVIVDDTNLADRHIAQIMKIVITLNKRNTPTEVEVKNFECDVYECIKRDSQRINSVGKRVIMDMYDKYIKPKQEVVEKKWQEGLPSAIICDIDGTLAKMQYRSPFEWAKVETDELNTPIAEILNKYKSDTEIIIFSGRDEVCRNETEAWLDKHKIPRMKLVMRPAGDNSDDRVIKKAMYDEHINGKYNVLFVLDDRDKVVEMWRSLGLTCLQVADGNF